MRMLLLDNGYVGGDYQQWAWISCHCQRWFVGCCYRPGQNIVFLFTQSTFFLIYVASMDAIHMLVYACRYVMYGFLWCVHMYVYTLFSYPWVLGSKLGSLFRLTRRNNQILQVANFYFSFLTRPLHVVSWDWSTWLVLLSHFSPFIWHMSLFLFLEQVIIY